MKKVTILALHLGMGGIEKYISSLCKILENDCEIEIICTYKIAEEPTFPFSSRIKIKYLIFEKPDDISIKELARKKQFLKIGKELLRRQKLKILEHIRTKRAIQQIETDYLITTRVAHHMLVKKYFNNKKTITIATEHNYHNDDKKYLKKLFTAMTKFHYLVVCTKSIYQEYQDYLTTTKCIYIPNFIDYIPTKKTTFVEPNLIAVGRFSVEKGFLDLLDVFALVEKELENSKLFLIGEGYQRKEIEEKIELLNLKDKVVLPGFISLEEQQSYYMKSSLYVMTSYTEFFGLVLIEAMSFGVPCITFDNATGPSELLKDGIGVVVKGRDKEYMAKEIIRLLQKKEALFVYQEKLDKYIQRFTSEEIKKEWYKILNK